MADARTPFYLLRSRKPSRPVPAVVDLSWLNCQTFVDLAWRHGLTRTGNNKWTGYAEDEGKTRYQQGEPGHRARLQTLRESARANVARIRAGLAGEGETGLPEGGISTADGHKLREDLRSLPRHELLALAKEVSLRGATTKVKDSLVHSMTMRLRTLVDDHLAAQAQAKDAPKPAAEAPKSLAALDEPTAPADAPRPLAALDAPAVNPDPVTRRTLPPRTLDTMSEVISMGSPNGRVSARSADAARARLSEQLFGPGGLERPTGFAQTSEQEVLRRNADTLADLASRGMKPIKYKREAESLRRQADELDAAQNAPQPLSALDAPAAPVSASKQWIDFPRSPVQGDSGSGFGTYADGTRIRVGRNSEPVIGEIDGIPITSSQRGVKRPPSAKTRQAIIDAFNDPDTRKAIADAGIHTIEIAPENVSHYQKKWTMAHNDGVLMINPITAERNAAQDKIRGYARGITGLLHHEAGHGLWTKSGEENRAAFRAAIAANPDVQATIAKRQNIEPNRDRFDDGPGSAERYRTGEVHAELNAIRRYDPALYSTFPDSVRRAVDAIAGVRDDSPQPLSALDSPQLSPTGVEQSSAGDIMTGMGTRIASPNPARSAMSESVKPLSDLNAAGGSGMPPVAPPVATLHGRTPSSGGKPATFIRPGKGTATVGEVFKRKNGQRYVVTSASSRHVSGTEMEDRGTWGNYPKGAGQYTHYTGVPIEDTDADRAEDADDSAEKKSSADEAAAKMARENADWSPVESHPIVDTLPSHIDERSLQWRTVSDERTQQPMGKFGRVREIAELPNGDKIGRDTRDNYDDRRVSYRVPPESVKPLSDLEPAGGSGMPMGYEFLGQTKKYPAFRGPDGRVYVRGKDGKLTPWSGEAFDAAKHIRTPASPDAPKRAAEIAEQSQRAAEDALAVEAKAEDERRAQGDIDRQAREAEYARNAVEREAREEAARQKQEHKRANANSLDFRGNHSALWHDIVEGVEPGKVRLTSHAAISGKGYVAKLTGTGGEYGLEREFVSPKGSGERSADVGDGVYEVQTMANVRATPDRHYVRVEGGKPTIVTLHEAKMGLPESPEETRHKADAGREPIGPEVSHTHWGTKPRVGMIVDRDGAPHVVTQVGRGSYRSSDDLHDMGEFGREPGWETDVKVRPVAWQSGDPETPEMRRAKKAERKAKADRFIESFRPVEQAFRSESERPPEKSIPDLKLGRFIAGGMRPDRGDGYVIHPDGYLYRKVDNSASGDDWSVNNYSGYVVSRVRATPERIAAIDAAFGLLARPLSDLNAAGGS